MIHHIGSGPGTIRRALAEFFTAVLIFVVFPYLFLFYGVAFGVE